MEKLTSAFTKLKDKRKQNWNMLSNSKKVKKIDLQMELLRTLVAVIIAFAAAFIIILCVSDEPFKAFGLLIIGPFTKARYFNEVLVQMIPLAFTGLALAIMLQAGQFNLATEGSFIIGGVFAALVAITLPLSAGIHPIVAILFGVIGGIIICIIPAILKVSLGIGEMVVSLMMNYIAMRCANMIVRGAIIDPSAGILTSKEFLQTAILGGLNISGFTFQISLFVMLLVVVISHVYINKTRNGYALRMSGLNGKFVAFSGIGVGGVVLASQAIGGAISGGAGAMYTLSNLTRYDLLTTFPNKGFDGMIVSIIARNKPALIPLAAFFLAYIRQGAEIMSRQTDVSVEIMSIIQGIIIILVAGQALFANLRNKRIIKEVSCD